MAKAKAKEPKRGDIPTVVWVPVLVAIVSGAFGLGIAKINSSGDKGSRPKAGVELHLLNWGTQRVAPPPHLKYVFTGTGATGKDDVYVLGKYIIKGVGTEPQQDVSPPGEVKADGTWRVEWTFPDEPEGTDFTVFSVAPTSVLAKCPGALTCPAGGPTNPSGFPSELHVSDLLGADNLDRGLIEDSIRVTTAPDRLP